MRYIDNYGKLVRTDELYHHGILGMHWGIRRYQNPDGSLTAAGKKHVNANTGKEKKPSSFGKDPEPSIPKKSRLDKKIEKVIQGGNPKKILKYSSKMSESQLREAISRAELKRKLTRMSDGKKINIDGKKLAAAGATGANVAKKALRYAVKHPVKAAVIGIVGPSLARMALQYAGHAAFGKAARDISKVANSIDMNKIHRKASDALAIGLAAINHARLKAPSIPQMVDAGKKAFNRIATGVNSSTLFDMRMDMVKLNFDDAIYNVKRKMPWY